MNVMSDLSQECSAVHVGARLPGLLQMHVCVHACVCARHVPLYLAPSWQIIHVCPFALHGLCTFVTYSWIENHMGAVICDGCMQ